MILKDKPKYNSALRRNLDTLEITSECFKSEAHQSHYKSALNKDRTNKKVKALFDASGNIRYWKAWHCKETLLQNGNRLVGVLCRTRWCINCNNIRTAEYLRSYTEPLRELERITGKKWYFVTLTDQTIKERQLKAEISKRQKRFTRVKDNLRKRGLTMTGLRRLEITYNKQENKYHPHNHCLILGETEASQVIDEWLKQNPTADRKGQDMRIIGNEPKDLLEVFKYAVKDDITDDISAKASDTIYKALEGRRTLQTFGALKKVKEPKKEMQETTNCDYLGNRYEAWFWNGQIKDYQTALSEKMISTIDIETQINDEIERQKRSKGFLENRQPKASKVNLPTNGSGKHQIESVPKEKRNQPV